MSFQWALAWEWYVNSLHPGLELGLSSPLFSDDNHYATFRIARLSAKRKILIKQCMSCTLPDSRLFPIFTTQPSAFTGFHRRFATEDIFFSSFKETILTPFHLGWHFIFLRLGGVPSISNNNNNINSNDSCFSPLFNAPLQMPHSFDNL